MLADPTNVTARYYLGRALLELSRKLRDRGLADAAAHELQEALRLEPSYPGAAALRIKALGFAGHFEQAVAAAEALQRESEAAAHEHLLGALLAERSSIDGRVPNPAYDLERAVNHLLRALEMDPRNTPLRSRIEALLGSLERSGDRPPWLGPAHSRLQALPPP